MWDEIKVSVPPGTRGLIPFLGKNGFWDSTSGLTR
jgi:hypothetical protein